MTDIIPPSITLTACDPAEWERANGMSIKTACAFVVLVAEVTTARTERDAAIARADKAERERDEAIATLATTRAWRERDRTDLNSAMERTTNAIGRADKAEAELAAAWGRVVVTPAELQSRDQARDISLCRAVARADKAEKERDVAAISRGEAVYRGDKALVELDKANATITTLHDGGYVLAHDLGCMKARAENAEAEIEVAARLIRDWTAVYGGGFYKIAGSDDFLRQHTPEKVRAFLKRHGGAG